jgi:hypothetical protein
MIIELKDKSIKMIRIEILENERAFRDAVEERMEVSK